MSRTYPTIQHQWFEEVWNLGNTDLIDELLAPDLIAHGLKGPDGDDVRGSETFKSFYEGFRAAFPDLHITVAETVSEGDKVTALCRVQGTHTGAGIGFAPTNQRVDFTGICVVRVRDGKIVESWNNFDFLGLFQQLGVVAFVNQ